MGLEVENKTIDAKFFLIQTNTHTIYVYVFGNNSNKYFPYYISF
jgi:hypothetical protein